MSTLKIFKSARSQIAAAACAAAVSTLTLAGCGTTNPTAAATAPGNGTFPQTAGTAVDPNLPNTSGVTVIDHLLGTYDGTLIKTDGNVQQPYSFTLTKKAVAYNGQNLVYAYMTFDSTGAVGTVHFETYLGVIYLNNNGRYAFKSTVMNIAELSATPIAFYPTFGTKLINGTAQFDPTQSSVRIKDCVFSQAAVCSNDAMDVSLASDLRKR